MHLVEDTNSGYMEALISSMFAMAIPGSWAARGRAIPFDLIGEICLLTYLLTGQYNMKPSMPAGNEQSINPRLARTLTYLLTYLLTCQYTMKPSMPIGKRAIHQPTTSKKPLKKPHNYKTPKMTILTHSIGLTYLLTFLDQSAWGVY